MAVTQTVVQPAAVLSHGAPLSVALPFSARIKPGRHGPRTLKLAAFKTLALPRRQGTPVSWDREFQRASRDRRQDSPDAYESQTSAGGHEGDSRLESLSKAVLGIAAAASVAVAPVQAAPGFGYGGGNGAVLERSRGSSIQELKV